VRRLPPRTSTLRSPLASVRASMVGSSRPAPVKATNRTARPPGRNSGNRCATSPGSSSVRSRAPAGGRHASERTELPRRWCRRTPGRSLMSPFELTPSARSDLPNVMVVGPHMADRDRRARERGRTPAPESRCCRAGRSGERTVAPSVRARLADGLVGGDRPRSIIVPAGLGGLRTERGRRRCGRRAQRPSTGRRRPSGATRAAVIAIHDRGIRRGRASGNGLGGGIAIASASSSRVGDVVEDAVVVLHEAAPSSRRPPAVSTTAPRVGIVSAPRPDRDALR
jgi:hypothetical protein